MVKVLCLVKGYGISIREKLELKENDEMADQSIPTMFNEETDLSSGYNMDILKCHYLTCYWKVHKDFLEYFEDSCHKIL
jgi:hypothetical protein